MKLKKINKTGQKTRDHFLKKSWKCQQKAHNSSDQLESP